MARVSSTRLSTVLCEHQHLAGFLALGDHRHQAVAVEFHGPDEGGTWPGRTMPQRTSMCSLRPLQGLLRVQGRRSGRRHPPGPHSPRWTGPSATARSWPLRLICAGTIRRFQTRPRNSRYFRHRSNSSTKAQRLRRREPDSGPGQNSCRRLKNLRFHNHGGRDRFPAPDAVDTCDLGPAPGSHARQG